MEHAAQGGTDLFGQFLDTVSFKTTDLEKSHDVLEFFFKIDLIQVFSANIGFVHHHQHRAFRTQESNNIQPIIEALFILLFSCFPDKKVKRSFGQEELVGSVVYSLSPEVLAEDITHRKEEEMQRILSQKLESLGKMAVNIAHEIKTPLQYIGNKGRYICDSFSDLLKFFESLNQSLTDIKKSNLDVAANIKKIIEEYKIELILEEIPKASDHIVNGVSRLSTIIQSMKDYSYSDRDDKEKFDSHQTTETTPGDNSTEEESDF
jgi:signal transduction histidine kinase